MIILGLRPGGGHRRGHPPPSSAAPLWRYRHVASPGIQTLANDLRDNRNAATICLHVDRPGPLVTQKEDISRPCAFGCRSSSFGSGVSMASLTAIILTPCLFHIGRQACGRRGGRQEDQPDDVSRWIATVCRDLLPMFSASHVAGRGALGNLPFASSELSRRERRAGGNAQRFEELIASKWISCRCPDGQGDEQPLADMANLSVGDLTDKVSASRSCAPPGRNALGATVRW